MASTVQDVVTAAQNACDVAEQFGSENGWTGTKRIDLQTKLDAANTKASDLQTQLDAANATVATLQGKIDAVKAARAAEESGETAADAARTQIDAALA